jgi:hypothetical protein
MRCAKIVLGQAIGLAMSIVLLGGCESSQQTGRAQEKRELQKTVKAQQAEIDELKLNVEATTAFLFEVTEQLAECKGLSPKAEEQKKQNPKITKRPERKRVPRTRTSAKPQPKTSKTKRTGGCPCRQKRTK